MCVYAIQPAEAFINLISFFFPSKSWVLFITTFKASNPTSPSLKGRHKCVTAITATAHSCSLKMHPHLT